MSLTSWYTALILGSLRDTNASYIEILVYYIIAVVVVGVGLQWLRARLHAPKKI